MDRPPGAHETADTLLVRLMDRVPELTEGHSQASETGEGEGPGDPASPPPATAPPQQQQDEEPPRPWWRRLFGR